jgi:hypothetical protein
MNKNILLVCLLSGFFSSAYAQLKLDSFVFRNDIDVNYNLPVRNNDINKDSLRITTVTKLGSNASKYILNISADSLLINIFSTDITLDTGTFIYKTIHKNLSIDSTYVFFQRLSVANAMYPGDCNKDNLVNHLDLFPIGIFYNKLGYPRHLDDTAISFSPKKTTHWFFQSNGVNAAHADVDGNGIVNNDDKLIYQANFGNSKGNYTPLLSGVSSSVQLKLSIGDTIDLNSPTGKVNIPVLINSATKINAYGIGYSYTIRVLNKSNAPLDSFYPHAKFINTNIWDEKETIFVKDTISFREHVNVAYVRINQANGDMDPQAGIIEVVTDEVLLGIANQKDVSYINILLKEVSLIDKDMTTIPITPVSKRIYFRKAASSISSTILTTLKVYPTLIDEQFSIEKLNTKLENYTIYNTLGQEISSGTLTKIMTYIQASEWQSGIYFLKLESMPGVIKLQKQ